MLYINGGKCKLLTMPKGGHLSVSQHTTKASFAGHHSHIISKKLSLSYYYDDFGLHFGAKVFDLLSEKTNHNKCVNERE